MNQFDRSRHGARGVWPLLGALSAALALFAVACISVTRHISAPQVSSDASAALEEARTWARSNEPAARERAQAAIQRAIALAPDWIGPRRVYDEMRRDDLLGIEALAEHRAALEKNPDDPVELYLAGRLEGSLGYDRFLRAAQVAPDLAWSQHGLGFIAAEHREWALAQRHAERALSLARDPWERSYFSATLARYLVGAEKLRPALAVLEARLADPEISQVDHVELSVQSALIELSLFFQPESHRGYERALDLMRECDLTDREIEQLVAPLRLFQVFDGGSLDLQLALASRPGLARDRLRAELMLAQRSTPLALGLLRRGSSDGSHHASAGPLLRSARFAAGQFALGVGEWLGDLPGAVLEADGLPRDEHLRALAEAAQKITPTSGADELAQFGDLLVTAGWFREARSVAAMLAVDDLQRALQLEDRAAAGQALLTDIDRLMQSLDHNGEVASVIELGAAGAELGRSDALAHPKTHISDLNGMLAAMAPFLARADKLLGGETDAQRIAQLLSSSPLLEYASVGTVVHPGPTFSKSDEKAGLGKAGDKVPGLASVLDDLGRFGVFGQVLGGGGPDGTMLQRVLVEHREGEHLGVPWSGTVAWCEGADLKSRAGRQGADISGAALHEGYWVDIDALRREREPWTAAERQFLGDAGRDRLDRALATRGLALSTPREKIPQRRAERCDIGMLLGEADRMRLAVLRDRAANATALDRSRGLVSLDELLEETTIHEEGHLCDRTRFLPISKHLGRALKLLLSCGLSPTGVARRLEFRAQLIAVCEARDPRIPLVPVLRATEGADSGITPHAAAYRELLSGLIHELDIQLVHDPAAWPEIDPDYVLAHQLHRLPPERLRKLARSLARSEGLFER
jgi:hypothetical protein